MKFSLIIPSINRKKQVIALLASIEKLDYHDYEVIIVDQNRNGLLEDVFCEYHSQVKHVMVEFVGAARARNHGAMMAKGDILLFPDDDSELTSDILNKAASFFEQTDIDVLFGSVQDKAGKSDVRFEQVEMPVTYENMFHTTSECTMFIRADIFRGIGGFDVAMGVGTFYGADEGADLFLRLLYQRYRLLYCPQLVFYHPQKVKNNYIAEISRGYTYGRGFGKLVFKHMILYHNWRMLLLFLYFQYRALGGLIVGMIKLNKGQTGYYLATITGRMVGFCCYAREYMLGK